MNDDDRLIELALAGDSAAFGRIVVKYQDRLFNTLVHVVGFAEEAQDVAQEAFVLAFQKLRTFKRNSGLYTWLYRIAMNAWISRNRRKRPNISVEAVRESTGTEPEDTSESPEQGIEREEQIMQIRHAIAELSDEHRNVLVLRDIDGCCYDQISEMLEIPVGTVRSRLHRARMDLKTKLCDVLYENIQMTANSNSNENEFISDELLSGYLDDELSAEERTRVERALKSDPRRRQTLSELRTLREGLGALPKQKVDARFQQRVLDRIAHGESSTDLRSEVAADANPPDRRIGRYFLSFGAIAAGFAILIVANRNPEPRVADLRLSESELSRESSMESAAAEHKLESNESQTSDAMANIKERDDVQERGDVANKSHEVPSSSLLRQQTVVNPQIEDAVALESDANSAAMASDVLGGESNPGVNAATAATPNSRAVLAPRRKKSGESIRMQPEQLAELVLAVRQHDQVDLVVGVKNTERDVIVALLPEPLEEPSVAQDSKTETFVIDLNSAELNSLIEKLRSAGGEIAAVQTSARSAKSSDPAVQQYFYRFAETEPRSQQRRLRSYQDRYDSLERQSDLFVDLDAGSPATDEASLPARGKVQTIVEFDAMSELPVQTGADERSEGSIRVIFVPITDRD